MALLPALVRTHVLIYYTLGYGHICVHIKVALQLRVYMTFDSFVVVYTLTVWLIITQQLYCITFQDVYEVIIKF